MEVESVSCVLLVVTNCKNISETLYKGEARGTGGGCSG